MKRRIHNHILITELGWDRIVVMESCDGDCVVKYSRSYSSKRNRRMAAIVGKWRADIWDTLWEFCDGSATSILNANTGLSWPDYDFYWEGGPVSYNG